jgi:ribosomal protein S18 acetylase RimI-like enzyme
MKETPAYDIVKNDLNLTFTAYDALECDCFPAAPNSEVLFREAMKRDYWTARIDGQLAGYADTVRHPDRLQIGRLEVHSRYRSCGIGGALLDKVLEYARQLALPSAALSVRENNETAYRLYHRKGFREHSRKYRYAIPVCSIPDETAVAFVKAGEGRGHQYPVTFNRNSHAVGSGMFSIEVGGVKDFVLENPQEDLLPALSALKAQLKPGSTQLYIVAENPETVKALQALEYTSETIFINMTCTV